MKTRNQVDYCTLDYEGFRTMLLKELVKRIPEYTDLSSSDAGIALLELQAHGLDILSYYADKIANEVYLDTAMERENIIMLAKNMGYILNDGQPSKFYQVFEIVPQETDYVIPRGFKVKTSDNNIESSVIFETDEDLIIPAGCTGLETDSNGYIYQVPITQGYTVENEIIGTSSGARDQRFTLSSSPVIRDSVNLQVTNLAGITEEWTRVNTFLNSSPEDEHFVLHIDGADRGVVVLGNGNSGKIPEAYVDGLVATYRVGGGELGNVSPNTITNFEQKLAGMVSTFNPYTAYELGIDKESDQSIKIKAPASFRSTWGAITVQDYADIALNQTNILKATSEKYKDIDVKVYLVPYNYFELSDVELQQIKSSLMQIYRDRKTIGTDVYIEFANKVPVDVELTVHLHDKTLRADANYMITSAVESMFKLEELELGEIIHNSMVMSEVLQVEGVKFVECNINGYPEGGKLNPQDILTLNNLSIKWIGGV